MELHPALSQHRRSQYHNAHSQPAETPSGQGTTSFLDSDNWGWQIGQNTGTINYYASNHPTGTFSLVIYKSC
jgi:hypothetical protein